VVVGGTAERAHLALWGPESCRRVHEGTLSVLEECGVEVRNHPQSLELFAAAGAQVDGPRVRLAPELVERALASAPKTWLVPWRPLPDGGRSHANDDGAAVGRSAAGGAGRAGAPRGPLTLSDGNSYFGPGSDCLYLRDPDTRERRRVTAADVEGLARVCDRLPNLDFAMSMGLPGDVPLEVDDLAAVVAMLAGTRKPLLVAPKDGLAVGVVRDMAAACGEAGSVMIYAMPSPPLLHDGDALGKVVACAELEVPLIYAPSPACGTTAPRSVPAAVVVGNAEVLSGLVLHQHVRPGAPFVYGAGVGAPDMRTAFDPHGAPEVWLGSQLGADLARFYGLPSFNYAGMTDANDLDEQWSAEEFAFTVLGALQRSTLIHDVGYLEVGLQSSYESLVFGEECVAWARALMRDVRVDDEALALDEIMAVGPGGHHLARRYTRRHTRDFWLPALFDRAVHDRWRAGGGLSLRRRVEEKVAGLRAEPPAWELPESARAGLDALLDEARRRRAEVAA
jgi:trimethylamine--corrinoid protein Co-methyltransferase